MLRNALEGERIGTYMRHLIAAAVIGFSSLPVLACHHTGQGIKADVKNDLHKTGEGIERTGEKIEKKTK
jgi:hypothetical protein